MSDNRVFLVTKDNWAWVSENTGWSLKEVEGAYKRCQAQGIVCTMKVKGI